MELRELKLKRYKCFDQDASIKIAPLTILVGANNSGKTALMRSIHLLSSSLNLSNGDNREPLLLEADGMRHGKNFQDLVTRRSAHGQLSLSAIFKNNSSEVQLSVKIQNMVNPSKPSESEGLIDYWSLRAQSDQVEAKRKSLDKEAPYGVIVKGVNQGEQTIRWRGLLPAKDNIFPDWLSEKMDSIKEWASDVRYLKFPRSFPTSRLSLSNYSPNIFDSTGATVPFVFATNDDLRDSVREWYRNVFGCALEIKTKADIFDLIVRTKYYRTNVAMNQSGTGLAQFLPVAITAFSAKKMGAGVDIIEHPEAVLHPAAHADVAELLVKNLPGSVRPIIIETHSEMILLRIRRLIAEGLVPRDKVIVYWIDSEAECGSKLQQISITDKGAMSSWPEGVFYEDYEEILAIQRAARNRRM